MDNIEQIKLTVDNKFKVDISEEEIEAIITSQSRTTKWAIENDLDVYWIYFGKFKKKLGRVGALLKSEVIKTIVRLPLLERKKAIKRIGIGSKTTIENKYDGGESIIKID